LSSRRVAANGESRDDGEAQWELQASEAWRELAALDLEVAGGSSQLETGWLVPGGNSWHPPGQWELVSGAPCSRRKLVAAWGWTSQSLQPIYMGKKRIRRRD